MKNSFVKCECNGMEALCEKCEGTGKYLNELKIVIICEGGLVQTVFASPEFEGSKVEIIDHDTKECSDEEEIREYEEKFQAFETERVNLVTLY